MNSVYIGESLISRASNLDGPALKPPDGLEPNFDNPLTRNVEAHIGIAICLFLMLVAVSLRVVSRIYWTKQFRVEDFLALAGLGAYVGFVYGIYDMLISPGYYVHQWNVRLKDLARVLKIVYNCTALYEASMMAIKAAILLEWVRMFVPRGTRNSFWWIAHMVLGLNTIYYTSSILVSAFSCNPREKIWNKIIPGTCLDTKIILATSAAINILSDLVVLILPQKVIWSLRMSTNKKINTSLVFIVGIMACIAAIVRLAEAVKFFESEDVVYHISGVSLWCLAETTCAYLVFCLPSAPQVLRRPMTSVKRRLGLSTSDSSRPGGNYSQRNRTNKRGRNHLASGSNEHYHRLEGRNQQPHGYAIGSVGTARAINGGKSKAQASEFSGSFHLNQTPSHGILRTTSTQIELEVYTNKPSLITL